MEEDLSEQLGWSKLERMLNNTCGDLQLPIIESMINTTCIETQLSLINRSDIQMIGIQILTVALTLQTIAMGFMAIMMHKKRTTSPPVTKETIEKKKKTFAIKVPTLKRKPSCSLEEYVELQETVHKATRRLAALDARISAKEVKEET